MVKLYNPKEDKEKKAEHKALTQFKNYWLKYTILFLYLGLNVAVVLRFYWFFKNDPGFNYLYMIGGPNLFASRAFGAGLNFNCLIILLPMNKTINSWIRTYILKYFPRTPRRTFDYNKGIHILCAYIIAVYSLAHTILHLVNAYLLHNNFAEAHPGLNAFKSREETTVNNFLRSVPGWTGLVLLILLAIIFITAFKGVRRQSFETFLYCHQLALVFLLFMCVHGLGMVTKKQINLDEHPVECQDITRVIPVTENPKCKAGPKFEFIGAGTWKWLLAPLLLHFFDRMFRYCRSFKECKLVKVAVHDGQVTELLMYKKDFSGKMGQYVRVNIPEIDDLQWHAFTLTKVPSGPTFEEKTFSVHIKAVGGGWTMQLLELAKSHINRDQGKGNVNRVGESCLVTMTKECALPKVRIDGPYGSPNQDGYTTPINISVAAGIGITPYACMLNSLKYYNPNDIHKLKALQKFHLIWACRGLKDFNWLVKLMFEVEDRFKDLGHPDLVECHLYVTQGYKKDDKEEEVVEDFKANDIGAWMRKKMHGGRPKFKEILTNIGTNYHATQIGVFFCGPPSLGSMLEEECKSISVQNNIYLFHKESFG